MIRIVSVFGWLLLISAQLVIRSHAFQNVGISKVSSLIQPTNHRHQRLLVTNTRNFRLRESTNEGDAKKDDDAAAVASEPTTATTTTTTTTTAATNTVNERLMNELKEATETEKFGKKGKKLSLVDGYGRTRKTDAEMKIAIEEARDLNGVNPVVAIVGSFFAFAVAGALWVATSKLGTYFAGHPPTTDVYFVQRTAQVFRNVVMGMISLASGFFGVTGVGIFSMGVRVAYGVATGELDPTPIKKRSSPTKKSVDLGNMMDLMMNKKKGRGRK